MDSQIQDAYARSFSGQLYAMATDRYVPLRLSRTRDKWTWGITPQDDWLMAGGEKNSIHLDFAFDSQTHDRLHYHISLSGNAYPLKTRPEPERLSGFLSALGSDRLLEDRTAEADGARPDLSSA